MKNAGRSLTGETPDLQTVADFFWLAYLLQCTLGPCEAGAHCEGGGCLAV
jgi:hypothetical protein